MIDRGGMPEHAATDNKVDVYLDTKDRDTVAVVDAKTTSGSPGTMGLKAGSSSMKPCRFFVFQRKGE
jgi:hypothetical protein